MDAAQTQARTLVAEASYPEGPLCLDGDLLWVEFGRDAVMILGAEETQPRLLWSRPGAGPAAVIAGAQNDLWVTGYGCDALIHLSRAGETLELIERDTTGEAIIGPNDLVLDAARGPCRAGARSDRGVFFTASGVFELDAPVQGRVLYRRPDDGSVVPAADAIHYANGIAFSPDQDTLYVAEHFTNSVLRYRVGPDGALSHRQVHADLTTIAPAPRFDEPKLGPDGLKVLPSGVLLVAQYGGGRLITVAPNGTLAGIIDVPLQYSTNVALHPDEASIVVTAFGQDAPPYAGALFQLPIPTQLR